MTPYNSGIDQSHTLKVIPVLALNLPSRNLSIVWEDSSDEIVLCLGTSIVNVSGWINLLSSVFELSGCARRTPAPAGEFENL
ncbi:6355_t:CDS:2 [Acaulospora colombiana]|uniref:6355_t:CDS:1 n=1 Tax=Acaulospora colombiana TaxID=27376 RepID=A0ACA9K0N0_9GLOM|nr:6355_t:CDS:2 [Acaulospora colombiana]